MEAALPETCLSTGRIRVEARPSGLTIPTTARVSIHLARAFEDRVRPRRAVVGNPSRYRRTAAPDVFIPPPGSPIRPIVAPQVLDGLICQILAFRPFWRLGPSRRILGSI